MAWEGFSSEGFSAEGTPFDKIGGSPADVIGQMADVLDEAANAVSTQTQGTELSGPASAPAVPEYQADTPYLGLGYSSAGWSGGPEETGASTFGGPASAPAVPDLGPNPSFEELEAVLSGAGMGDAMGPDMSGGPQTAPAVPENLMGGPGSPVEDAATAGQDAATFLSDYRSAMNPRPDPHDSLMSQLAALQTQAQDLRNIATGLQSVQKGYPNPGMVSGDPVRVDADYQSRGYPSMAGPNYGAAISALNTPGGFSTTTPYASPEQAVATAIEPTAYPSMAGVDYGAAISALGTPGGFSTRTPYVDKVKTHEEWYPNHTTYAGLAGVAGIRAALDGSNRAWKETIKDDMRKRGIIAEDANKYMSEDWIAYEALFDQNGVALDGSGVMPGTDRVQEVGFFEKFVKPYTKSGVGSALATAADTPLGPYGTMATEVSDYVPSQTLDAAEAVVRPVTGSGDAEVGAEVVEVREPKAGTIEWMRAEYPWAKNLADNVLKNAIKYPDYLRLIQEAVANNEDIPLVVPDWILSGRVNPDHPALQSRPKVF